MKKTIKILLFSLEFFKNKKQSYQTDTCEGGGGAKLTYVELIIHNVMILFE